MKVLSVGCAHPPHRYEQEELIAAVTALWVKRHQNARRVEQLYRAVRVGGRFLALPMEQYLGLDFGKANDAFIRVGTDVGEQAMQRALASAGLGPRDVDALFFATVTGLATPTIDARLVNRMGLRSDIKRLPLFGLGCVAGAAGMARVYDYLRAWPDQVAVLLSVELCSLTMQQQDLSIPNLIATGLFGDGAAAVVAVGAERARAMGLQPGQAGPTVLATKSRFYRDTERVMGWDIGQRGFKIVLSPAVPQMVTDHLGEDVAGFLAEQGVDRAEVRSWVCHSGGPKVLEAFESALGLSREDTALTWRSLDEVGNLSSASVLFVLRDTIAERRPAAGTTGLMLAMGPGFCSELVLLRW